MKRGPQVPSFAREHGFKIISVADLIAHRQHRERLVDQRARFDVETVIGTAKGHSYVTPFDTVQQLALVFGDIGDGKNVPVRLHRENVLEDVFGSRASLTRAFDVFQREKRGVLVYLQEGQRRCPPATSRRKKPEAPANAPKPGAIWASAPRSSATSA